MRALSPLGKGRVLLTPGPGHAGQLCLQPRVTTGDRQACVSEGHPACPEPSMLSRCLWWGQNEKVSHATRLGTQTRGPAGLAANVASAPTLRGAGSSRGTRVQVLLTSSQDDFPGMGPHPLDMSLCDPVSEWHLHFL